jgi:hypothetical protein
MNQFLKQLADAITVLNDIVPAHLNFREGIGPYSENLIVDQSIAHIYGHNREGIFVRPRLTVRNVLQLQNYLNWNGNRATPDLIIDNKIVEFKLCRPIKDNGGLEETWMTKIFNPVPNSGSAMADVYKMNQFRQHHDPNRSWELWVVIIGFERHNEQEYCLDSFFPGLFQYVSQNCLGVSHEQFLAETRVMSNRHDFHQTLKLFAFRY